MTTQYITFPHNTVIVEHWQKTYHPATLRLSLTNNLRLLRIVHGSNGATIMYNTVNRDITRIFCVWPISAQMPLFNWYYEQVRVIMPNYVYNEFAGGYPERFTRLMSIAYNSGLDRTKKLCQWWSPTNPPAYSQVLHAMLNGSGYEMYGDIRKFIRRFLPGTIERYRGHVANADRLFGVVSQIRSMPV